MKSLIPAFLSSDNFEHILRSILAVGSLLNYLKYLKLAKYLAEILKPVVGKSEHHVVNSKEFIVYNIIYILLEYNLYILHLSTQHNNKILKNL